MRTNCAATSQIAANDHKPETDRSSRGGFYKYDVSPDEVGYVLLDDVDFAERQRRSIGFINGVLTEHGKGPLLSSIGVDDRQVDAVNCDGDERDDDGDDICGDDAEGGNGGFGWSDGDKRGF